MSRWEECLRHAMAHAAHLRRAVEAGQLNESAVTGLMRGYLEQPGFELAWREDLLKAALATPENGGYENASRTGPGKTSPKRGKTANRRTL